MKHLLSGMIIAFLAATPVEAATVQVRAGGVLSGFDFGEPAANTLFTQVPVGSPFSFNFSYDPSVPRTFGGVAGGTFYNLAINGNFALGGVNFALPVGSVSTGNGFGGSSPQFVLFANFPNGSPRLNGFFPVDFRFELNDGIGTPIPGINLPSSLRLEDFGSGNIQVRFAEASGTGRETRLRFTMTSLTSSVTAVPEPGAWAMLLAGFGIVGGAVRVRNRSSRTATSPGKLSTA